MRCINNALFRRIELQLLMNLTARALRRPARRIWTLPNGEALRVYAAFTREALQNGVDDEVIRRMNDEAYRMGRRLRRLFWLRRQADIEAFVTTLYRHIGIRIEGHLPGHLCFRHCYFSHFYSPDICLAASALDDGIMRGLAGSGHLRFQQRITEGYPCCKAVFSIYQPR